MNAIGLPTSDDREMSLYVDNLLKGDNNQREILRLGD